MAGHVIAEYLVKYPEYEVVRCARNAGGGGLDLDVTDFSALEDVLEQTSPEIVINAVGMLVAACDSSLAQAIIVNSYLPQRLSELAVQFGFKLIHISTDCVFSGKKGQYLDSDFRDGDTNYARTKILGEVINDHDLTVRTSIIGPELKPDGTGLFHWVMQQHDSVKGYSRAYWSGVTTLELAKVIHLAIEQNITGLFQLTMKHKISKYDLLLLFQHIWQKEDVNIFSNDHYSCDKSMVLSDMDFKYNPPESYEVMLQDMKRWMDGHAEFYPHYQPK